MSSIFLDKIAKHVVCYFKSLNLEPMLKIKKLYPDVIDPIRAYPTDSGLDLCAYLPTGNLVIKPAFHYLLEKPEVEREYSETLDGYSIIEKTVYKDLAVDSVVVPTGIAIKLPEPKTFTSFDNIEKGILVYEGHIRPRSGLSAKYSISAHFGTIDSTYTGEIKVILFNFSNKPFTITHGMRIAQLAVAPIVIPDIVFVDDLDERDRGNNGFGSTGLVSV